MVVLMLFLYGVGPFWIVPEVAATKRTILFLDRSYSARPLAAKLADQYPWVTTVAVFRVRRDMEYGLAFYRNHEVSNYEEKPSAYLRRNIFWWRGLPARAGAILARRRL